MLGGNFWVSFFRNGIGAGLMLAVFLMLDRPKVAMKKAVDKSNFMPHSIWLYGGYAIQCLVSVETGYFCTFFGASGFCGHRNLLYAAFR